MHTYCYNVYKRNSTSCPTCNKSWKPLPVGEEAWKEGQDKGKRRVRQKDSEERSEDEEEEAEQEGRGTCHLPISFILPRLSQNACRETGYTGSTSDLHVCRCIPRRSLPC